MPRELVQAAKRNANNRTVISEGYKMSDKEYQKVLDGIKFFMDRIFFSFLSARVRRPRYETTVWTANLWYMKSLQ
jgi:hypothetical protein